MNIFKLMCTFVAVLSLSSCSASTNGKGEVKSSGSMVTYKSATTTGGHEAQPQESSDAPPPAQPAVADQAYGGSQPMLPPECLGKVPAARKVGNSITSCTCESGKWRSTWATYPWDGNFPNCKVPYPDQVVRGMIGNPNQPEPYESKGAAEAAGRVHTTRNAESSQVKCATTMKGDERIAVCQVKRGDAEPESYACLGPGVKPLSLAEQANYSGGPPCTCTSGAPQKVGSLPNTWQCK